MNNSPEDPWVQRRPIGKSVGAYGIMIGGASVVISLSSYFLATTNVVLSPAADVQLESAAIATLTAFALGLVLLLVGVHIVLSVPTARNDSKADRSWKDMVSFVLSNARPRLLFTVSAILYGVIFAFTSGTVVYDSTVNYSRDYGLALPSSILVTCCDSIGQTPRLVIYLSDHLGVLLIPLNILFLVSV
ncbi:MAG TPA: hypothetical protein VE177_03520, partial [Candidatus Binatus sp.]|nr:hypothetical protein [Candidatus Binatus sp.]